VVVEDAFSISVLAGDGVRIFVFRGELDELAAREFDDLIDVCPDGLPVIIDLSALTFVSSAGIYALLRERHTKTALVCPPGNVMRLFEIVRVNRRVPVFEDMDTTLDSLAPVCAA
jgi:anti-anti-sigma factor